MKQTLSAALGKSLGGTSFEWNNPRSTSTTDLDPERITKAPEFVARLPLSSRWIRSGVVERQTASTDVQWQPRLLVLTASDIFFAKPDSDVILDKLPLRNIAFIGKVDTAQGALSEQGGITGTGIIGMSRSERMSKRMSRKRSTVKFSSSLKMDHMSDLQVRVIALLLACK